jgi:hypothetical protein
MPGRVCWNLQHAVFLHSRLIRSSGRPNQLVELLTSWPKQVVNYERSADLSIEHNTGQMHFVYSVATRLRASV